LMIFFSVVAREQKNLRIRRLLFKPLRIIGSLV
jgi:hypothetical protein